MVPSIQYTLFPKIENWKLHKSCLLFFRQVVIDLGGGGNVLGFVVLSLIGGKYGYRELRDIYITGGSISSLAPLNLSYNVRRVYISKDVLKNISDSISDLNYGDSMDANKRMFAVYVIEA